MSGNQRVFECRDVDLSFYDTAPQRFVFDRVLPVTPARLFEVFEDPASWPVWGTGIARVDWTSPQPYGVGTTRTVTFRGGMEVYEVFGAWEPGRRMAFHFTGATQRVWHAFGEHYLVEDLGDGRCRLTWTVAYEPQYVFKAIHGLVRPVMRWWLGRLADNLVTYCEALPAEAAVPSAA